MSRPRPGARHSCLAAQAQSVVLAADLAPLLLGCWEDAPLRSEITPWLAVCVAQVYKTRFGEGTAVAEKKIVFIAFAMEDEGQRNLFVGQRLHPRSPYEFIDMSVKEPYDSAWKERVRTRIKRSDGVIALVSKSSLTSSGELWEIQCAKEEGMLLRGIWAYDADRTNLPGVATVVWSDANISAFIDSL